VKFYPSQAIRLNSHVIMLCRILAWGSRMPAHYSMLSIPQTIGSISPPTMHRQNHMNQTKRSHVYLKLRPLVLCGAAVLLCACAATKVQNTWKSPNCPQPVGKIAVLAIEERGLVREGFENRFVRQLAQTGAPAVVTFDLLSLPDIKEDKRAAAERFRATGAQTVLIVRLAGKASSYHESRAGDERYVGTVTGIDTMGWYDYYSVAFMDMSPTYGNLKQTAYIEANLYDLTTEKRLWSGLTQTVMREDMDRVSEMDPVVEKFVAAMRKDGVVP
jgi:hypothetical protein